MAVINAEINYLCHMKWLHNLLKGVSLTGALFAFQACYGVPEPPIYWEQGEAPMNFSVVSHATGNPIKGVHVRGGVNKECKEELGITGDDGKCHVMIPYVRNSDGPFITFEDSQSKFVMKDTTLADLREREILIKLDPVE